MGKTSEFKFLDFIKWDMLPLKVKFMINYY